MVQDDQVDGGKNILVSYRQLGLVTVDKKKCNFYFFLFFFFLFLFLYINFLFMLFNFFFLVVVA